MFNLVLLFAFVAFGSDATFIQESDTNKRIVGGKIVRIENTPYQVSLRYNNGHFCGGSIINKYTILTAAHCTIGLNPSELSIMVGSEIINQGKVYRIKNYIQHPRYDKKTIDFDVSILKLTEPLQFNKKISPIKLQDANVNVRPGTIAMVSGWGGIYENDKKTQRNLRQVDVIVKSDAECKKLYRNLKFTESMMCAGKKGQDSCRADSGGPLVANGKLIGIVSWGLGCARPQFPGVYTKISYVKNWIDKYI